VWLNDEVVIEYDRNKEQSHHQLLFLEKMNTDMEKGITIGGEHIQHPDENDRIHYVAMKLIEGILTGNEALTTVLCAYITNRYDALLEIKAQQEGGQIVMTFIFD